MERTRFLKGALFPVLVLCGYGLWGGVERFGVMQPAIAQSQVQGISWGQIFDFLKRKRVRGGSRNPLFCAISPAPFADAVSKTDSSEDTLVWNVQPLFVWDGRADRIEVRQMNESYDLIWEANLTAQDQHIRYGGKALQLGQTYVWKVFVRDSQASTPGATLNLVRSSTAFHVVEGAKHQLITKELDRLEANLKQQKASPESLALQRANYFAQRGLWADVLLEAFSVKRRSPELTQLIESVPKSVCKTKQ
jgi:Domain of Unknown Function (DUF928)